MVVSKNLQYFKILGANLEKKNIHFDFANALDKNFCKWNVHILVRASRSQFFKSVHILLDFTFCFEE
jgi:hypothetical protein